MRMSELDYVLPPGAIAVRPAEPRDSSRLMVVRRGAGGVEGAVEHRSFCDIGDYLHPGDLLVTNNTRVLPARFELHKKTGGRVPGLFVGEAEFGVWKVMLRSRGKVREGDQLLAGPYAFAVEKRMGIDDGMWQLRVTPPRAAAEVLAEIGAMPIPPYIEKARREMKEDKQPAEDFSQRDARWYQTVFATEGKSVAAPTAGLHFTVELLASITAQGVRQAQVQLDVGPGTFLPVESETLEEHPMHFEHYHVPASTVTALRDARSDGRRIVVVGTTAVRTLEAAADAILNSQVPASNISDDTNLKIAPPYAFQLTDALVTNFHLPRSTLMALVGALVGVERLKDLYALAIEKQYRFYSYGDAMLIL